jgi:hypothetical protein
MQFDLIPAGELSIDQPDFKAGAWKPTIIDGEAWECSQCFEWIGGKWEGFVSIRRARKASRAPLPESLRKLCPVQ